MHASNEENSLKLYLVYKAVKNKLLINSIIKIKLFIFMYKFNL
jgi:hypothetical protein